MSQKPNDQLLESLSALVDDEASELEVRRILKNVDNNPDMMDCWQRYNLIGSFMRKETIGEELGNSAFAASVAAALRQESELNNPQSESTLSPADKATSSAPRYRSAESGGSSWSWLGKSSIAASFAAFVVLTANFVSSPDESTSNSAPPMARNSGDGAVQNSIGLPQGFQLPALEARTVSQSNNPARLFDSPRRTAVLPVADDLTDNATQDMLNEMLIFHAERASANGGLGMMPFARVSKMHHAR